MKLVNKVQNYYKEHGARGVAWRVVEKLTGRRPGAISYEKWISQNTPGEEELDRQRKETFAYMPVFSIVVPLYRTKEEYLRELVASVQAQTYGSWELCLSDGSGDASVLGEILDEYSRREPRIRVVSAKEPLGISENTNEAMKAASGDYLVFADHDDILSPDALYECARRLNEERDCDVLYSDEDKLSMDGTKRFDPQFKPDFNRDLLRSVNYICHLFVVKKSLADEAGSLDAAYDGAQDHDFILRCTEKAQHICHIPKILYHWRCHQDSTAVNQESKLYAFEAGQRAVQAHLERLGIRGEVSQGEYLGLYRTTYFIEGSPLVSVLIPNKDHAEDLKRCIASLREKSSYQNYEIIIIENNSTENATFACYEELCRMDDRIRIVTWKGHFNYSAINNFGVRYAAGDYLLFLNNDTELIGGDTVKEMLGICARQDVGAVGARLYYGDDTVQHAGVILGMGGIAGHAFAGERRSATGYCRRIICTQDLSAVTAACMMVKRSTFEQVGGFDESLEVTFNDVDLCLKIRGSGKLVVYTPYAELYHYESKSRGAEDSPEKVERFHREIGRFLDKWSGLLEKGDPFYSPNLTLLKPDFSLRDKTLEPHIGVPEQYKSFASGQKKTAAPGD